MIKKHKRKFILHINILRYLKTLSNKELILKMTMLREDLMISDSDFSTKNEWISMISDFDLNKFSKQILKRNDYGELLRQTSPLGNIVPQELIVSWKKMIVL